MTKSFAFGLIGYPLGHSLSPHMHRAALQATGLQGDYHLYAIEPTEAGQAELDALFTRMRRGEVHGLNVTIPHKQNVISYIDELTPTAEAIGAVNTIFMQNGSLTGDNTDAPAFLAEIHALKIEPEHKTALVLGAGGSARAVVFALVNDGWSVNLLARKPQQAQELADHFGDGVNAFAWDTARLQELSTTCVLLVNTTPLGMDPNVDASPWPADLPFPTGVAIYDLVYNPPLTRFVQQARKQDLLAQTGGGMLVGQAALAFERWTGQDAPRDIMRQILDKELAMKTTPNFLDSTQ